MEAIKTNEESKDDGEYMDTDFISVNIPISADNCKIGEKVKNHGNKDAKLVTNQTNEENKSIGGSEKSDLGNKFTKQVGSEEWMNEVRNTTFFWGFVSKTVQMIVALVLTVLAVVWQPLQQLVERNLQTLCISLVILTIIVWILMSKVVQGGCVCFVEIVICMIYTINYYWFLLSISYKLSNTLSLYWVILTAAVVTANYLFLSVLIFFDKTTYNDWAIYIFAVIVNFLFLIVCQIYYSYWYTKKAFDNAYRNYIINVLLGIGLATLLTFEVIYRTQKAVKGLEFKIDENGKIVVVCDAASKKPADNQLNGADS